MVTMTHKKTKSMPKIALYEPDIPQNTAAIARTCSCLGAVLEIIEPCGFLLNDNRFKRVVMDYLDEKLMKIYKSSDEFFEAKNVAFDIIGYPDAPPGLRIYTGATVEKINLQRLLPWLDYTYQNQKFFSQFN